ncbi:cytochrome c [Oleiagrimonas sp. C23AA]|uniref:c-type cytochrome n=1 Tax=Oleiagrimonas sp. C23AA TaxID=2719047 RepID=UPI001421637A|nr:cytochrome c [Oleiagrimonas sp. C23AA]NII09098.1 cytochrome c [Oleiagrimonas sp. C23AA]
MRVLTKWLSIVVLVLVAGLAFVFSGLYDIGADAPHWNVTRALITQLRERSIDHRLDSVTVPADLNDPARLHEGAEHYIAMCTGCHLAPGVHDSEMRKGLYPTPPDFAAMDHAIDPRKAFWVIKHGIKLTAMPAWGKTHSDEKIWDMVAFVRQLPLMSPQVYQQWVAKVGGHHDDDDDAPAAASTAPAATPAVTPAPATSTR